RARGAGGCAPPAGRRPRALGVRGAAAPARPRRSADEDRVARGRRRGHQRAAELGDVAVDLALPAGLAGLVVGAHDFVAHRRDQILLEQQYAGPLVRLHARDAPLADIAQRRGGIGGARRAATEPVHRVERFGLLAVGGFLLDFPIEILRFLFLELALGLPLSGRQGFLGTAAGLVGARAVVDVAAGDGGSRGGPGLARREKF